MNLETRYVLNHRDGTDVIHRWPSFEQCNVDQVKGKETIDALTADSLLQRGVARACEHCFRTGYI